MKNSKMIKCFTSDDWKEYNHEKYEKDKKHRLEYQKEYYEKHKEEIKKKAGNRYKIKCEKKKKK